MDVGICQILFLHILICCSVTKSCLTLCDPINCSLLGFPVLHYLPEFAQTHVRWISDAIQPSHLLLPPSPSAFNLSHHQDFSVSQLFASGSQSIGASVSASVLSMNVQGCFLLGLTDLISLLSKWKCHASLSMEFFRQKYWRWVAIPFSRISSQPRARTQVSRVAGGFFTVWATREALLSKEFSRVFSNTTVWKPQFFSAQLSL